MPQQRRAQLTRRAILAAAAEEFDIAGYDGTTLNAVLRRSGITKGAFYFHFPSKEAVAEELVAHYRQRLAGLRHRWSTPGDDALSVATGLTAELAAELERDVMTRAGMWLAHRRPEEVDAWRRSLAELLTSAVHGRLLRADADPAATARVVHAALLGACAMSVEGLADHVAEIWRVVLAGAKPARM